MKGAAGEGMWIPRADGDGAGTKDEGDGTCRVGLPGDPCIMFPGDGMLMMFPGDGTTG